MTVDIATTTWRAATSSVNDFRFRLTDRQSVLCVENEGRGRGSPRRRGKRLRPPTNIVFRAPPAVAQPRGRARRALEASVCATYVEGDTGTGGSARRGSSGGLARACGRGRNVFRLNRRSSRLCVHREPGANHRRQSAGRDGPPSLFGHERAPAVDPRGLGEAKRSQGGRCPSTRTGRSARCAAGTVTTRSRAARRTR